jgi:hypothetical protein
VESVHPRGDQLLDRFPVARTARAVGHAGVVAAFAMLWILEKRLVVGHVLGGELRRVAAAAENGRFAGFALSWWHVAQSML